MSIALAMQIFFQSPDYKILHQISLWQNLAKRSFNHQFGISYFFRFTYEKICLAWFPHQANIFTYI
jgi:hypothetical protein